MLNISHEASPCRRFVHTPELSTVSIASKTQTKKKKKKKKKVKTKVAENNAGTSGSSKTSQSHSVQTNSYESQLLPSLPSSVCNDDHIDEQDFTVKPLPVYVYQGQGVRQDDAQEEAPVLPSELMPTLRELQRLLRDNNANEKRTKDINTNYINTIHEDMATILQGHTDILTTQMSSIHETTLHQVQKDMGNIGDHVNQVRTKMAEVNTNMVKVQEEVTKVCSRVNQVEERVIRLQRGLIKRLGTVPNQHINNSHDAAEKYYIVAFFLLIIYTQCISWTSFIQ